MPERSIDPVSEAIGSLKSDVRTMLENQKSRDDIDAGFRREMRAALGGFALIPTQVAQLTADNVKTKEQVATLAGRLDRVRNMSAGAGIILSGLWIIILLCINKAPELVRLLQG